MKISSIVHDKRLFLKPQNLLHGLDVCKKKLSLNISGSSLPTALVSWGISSSRLTQWHQNFRNL